MKRSLPICFTAAFLLLLPLTLSAQNDTLPPAADTLPPKTLTRYQQIAAARLELRAAFEYDDPPMASLWLDSLMHLEDDTYTALVWDERWLLYYWMGWYGNLFDEAARFNAYERRRLAEKIQPPADSLFDRIDRALYARRFELFDQIQHAFLTEEERAFAVLQLEYLLRLDENKEEWNKRADAFTARYPTSRFTDYLRDIRPKIVKPARSALTGHLLITNGTWNDELERTLRPSWGAEIGFSYWYRRVSAAINIGIGGQKLDRDLEENAYVWPEGDPSTYLAMELEGGFDIIHTQRLRLFPSGGGGFSIITAPETEDDPNPDYYDNFRFFTGHFVAALNLDMNFPFKEENLGDGMAPGSSWGIRLRAGHRWMYFDRENPRLAGDGLFIGLGVQIFSRRIRK